MKKSSPPSLHHSSILLASEWQVALICPGVQRPPAPQALSVLFPRWGPSLQCALLPFPMPEAWLSVRPSANNGVFLEVYKKTWSMARSQTDVRRKRVKRQSTVLGFEIWPRLHWAKSHQLPGLPYLSHAAESFSLSLFLSLSLCSKTLLDGFHVPWSWGRPSSVVLSHRGEKWQVDFIGLIWTTKRIRNGES